MSYLYTNAVSINNSNNAPITNNTPLPVTGNVTVTNQNAAYTSAFDEPMNVTITPVIQQSAVYGLNPYDWKTTKLNGGNISTNAVSSAWEVSSGTSAGGYARLATSRYMTYQPGQGSMFRWTASYTTTGGTDKNAYGIDNVVQNVGPIDREDGYSIGYSGSTANNASRKIGFLHRRNGNAEIKNLTVTVAPTGAQTATITLNGVVFTISLTASTSTQYTATQIAQQMNLNVNAKNLWDIQACDSIVTFAYYSPGPRTGTFSFSSAGTGTLAAAAFSSNVVGVAPTDVWTYVDDWDNQTIQFDPTKLNVFGLDFRWLGSGIVRLFMEEPSTGKMVLLHTQKWGSQYTVPHLKNPSLRVVYRAGVSNSAVTPSQNVIVGGSSVFGGIQGAITQTTLSQSYFALDSTARAKDTVWHVLSIQNSLTRDSQVNKASYILQDLSASIQATDPSIIYVVKNSLGTSDLLVYNPLPSASILSPYQFVQYSTSAVSENLSLDPIVLVQTVGINGTANFPLLDYNLTLAPGENVSIFISSTSQISRSAIGLTWKLD